MDINIEQIETELIERRQALIGRMEQLNQEKTRADEPLTQDIDDQVIAVELDQVIDGLDDIAVKQLNLINSALERINEGEYGNCIMCGEKISAKRLKALPYVLTCINCADDKNIH